MLNNHLISIPNVAAYIEAVNNTITGHHIDAVLSEVASKLPRSIDNKMQNNEYRESVTRLIIGAAGVVVSAKTVSDEHTFDAVLDGLTPRAELIDQERRTLYAALMSDATFDGDCAVPGVIYRKRIQRARKAI